MQVVKYSKVISFCFKAFFRGFSQRQKYLRWKFSAVLIQQYYRAHQMRNVEQQRYHQMKRAAVRIQVIPEGSFCLVRFFFSLLYLFIHYIIMSTDIKKEWHFWYFPECFLLALENISEM